MNLVRVPELIRTRQGLNDRLLHYTQGKTLGGGQYNPYPETNFGLTKTQLCAQLPSLPEVREV